jgi:hypothetical protein
LPHRSITTKGSINDISGPILDLAEEDVQEPEVELDPSTDPIINTLTYPSLEWEEQIRKIEVRRPNIPSPESQKERVEWILKLLESEKLKPDPEQIEESLRSLSELESLIPDHTVCGLQLPSLLPGLEGVIEGSKSKVSEISIELVKSGLQTQV